MCIPSAAVGHWSTGNDSITPRDAADMLIGRYNCSFKKNLSFLLSLHLSLEPYTFLACCFPKRVLRYVRRINHWGECQDHCTDVWLASSSLHVLGVIWQEVVRVKGLPGGTSGKEPICQCRRCERSEFNAWIGKILWRRAWQPTPVFMPAESHGQRSLVGYSPQDHKESDTTKVTENARTSSVVRITNFQFHHLCIESKSITPGFPLPLSAGTGKH